MSVDQDNTTLDDNSGSDDSSIEIEETLESVAERLARKIHGWEITHKEYNQWQEDKKDTVKVENRDLYDRDHQTHSRFDTTGAGIEIEKHDTASYKRDLFKAKYKLFTGTATTQTRTLVTYTNTEEVIEWAVRVINAIENTPDGWVPVEHSGVDMAKWSTLNGNFEVNITQDGRNLHDAYRTYKLSLSDNVSHFRIGDTNRSTLQKDLRTSEVYGEAIKEMERINKESRVPYTQINE